MEAAKLDDFTFHDLPPPLRLSWFMMRGGSLQALREILGHRDIKMTFRYAHLAPGHLRDEIETDGRTGRRQHIVSTSVLKSTRATA